MVEVTAKEIADYLAREYSGENIVINKPVPVHSVASNSVFFIKKQLVSYDHFPIDSLAIVKDTLEISISSTVIKSSNPRLDFIKIIKKFFTKRTEYKIDSSIEIPASAKIHPDVFIGKNAIIEENVNIARGCEIYPNVYLGQGVSIGKNCVIKPGAVIGSSGFGYDFSDKGTPEYFPHIGSVVIGDNVHIGANTTVDRGTLGNTIIEDNVKIDNLVHVAHNCIIERNCIIIACAEISGGVTIGAGSWVSPNVSIKQKVKIGRNALLGLGAVVIRDIDDKEKVMGFDAMTLREYLSFKKKF